MRPRGLQWPTSSSSVVPASTTSRTSRSTCPRDALIVFTGLSGSGKSSLAFDTIFAEGQRRYVESLSAYARQFLGQMDKPDVDFIEGLSPAVSIDQKSTSKNPRSTVGTITEVYDYLRLLFARAGRPHCPTCGAPIERQTPQQIVDKIMSLEEGTRFQVLAPGDPRPQGRVRRAVQAAADPGLLPRPGQRRDPHPRRPAQARQAEEAHDRGRGRPAGGQGLEQATTDRLGRDGAQPRRRPGGASTSSTSTPRTRAASCGSARRWPAPTSTPSTPTSSSRARSRSTRPFGACPACSGLGTRMEVDPELVVPDATATLAEGAIQPWSQAHVADYFLKLMGALGDELGFDLDTPWEDIAAAASTSRARGPPDQGPRRHPQPLRPRARLLRRSSRACAPTSSAATARPSPTPAASASRASCARCRARPAGAAGSSRSRWRSCSAAATSPRSARCRSTRPPRSSPTSS